LARNRESQESRENARSETVKNEESDYYEDILLPTALLYGMTAKEFWNEDPALMWSYRLTFIQKQKNQNYRDNQLAYLTGLYNYSALSTVIHNSFSKEKPIEYMQPIDIDKIEEESKMTREEKIAKMRKENEDKIRKRAMEITDILSNNQKESGK
jgi:outer membrane receptor for ferrienterochelin and colicin